jgi:hypothetical protein
MDAGSGPMHGCLGLGGAFSWGGDLLWPVQLSCRMMRFKVGEGETK